MTLLGDYKVVFQHSNEQVSHRYYHVLGKGIPLPFSFILIGTKEEMAMLNGRLFAQGSSWLIDKYTDEVPTDHIPKCLLIMSTEKFNTFKKQS